MIILSHRGYWKAVREKNTEAAFTRSFSLGFGTETDVRDYCGDLVISHDIATRDSIKFESFLKMYKRLGASLPLALNIKADGLQDKLAELLIDYEIHNYFVFDMSIPDAVGYLKKKCNCFARQSEYEPFPAFYEEAAGVWMDSFKSDWIEESHIAEHLSQGKKVCVVSPDLHKRDKVLFWRKLSRMNVVMSNDLMVCTDFPEDARDFFYGKN